MTAAIILQLPLHCRRRNLISKGTTAVFVYHLAVQVPQLLREVNNPVPFKSFFELLRNGRMLCGILEFI